MKKSTLVLILVVFGVLFFKFLPTKKKIQEFREAHHQLLKNHVLNKTLQLSKKERLAYGIPPNKYFEEKYLLEINPKTGRTHPENIYTVQKELQEKRKLKKRVSGDTKENQWQERGPNNVGGRTRVVLFDPNDATHKRVFAAGVSGGLWVNDDITDANSSWTRIPIDENLSITCMAVDPNNSQIMYLGTGEIYSPAQALGNGIWKSSDGGNTWINVYKVRGVTSSGLVPGTYYITDIIVRDADGNPATTNDSEVFAGIGAAGYSREPIDTYLGFNDYGIFKSTDNGTNWNKITLDIEGNSVAPNDFEIGLDNTLWLATRRNVHEKGGGLIYSSSDGNTFTLKHTITNTRRTEIAVSKQNANTLYVLARVATLNVAETAFIAPFVSILKTTDAFATNPTNLALPNDADTNIPANDFTRGQGFYNLTVEVDPTNDAIAYVGGIDFFRTTDSGTNWTQISKWNSGSVSKPYFLDANLSVPTVHADQHTLVFHPADANKAIIGNDGGVYYATDLSAAASNITVINARNKDYNITQFYHGAMSPNASSDYFLGGTQDNGTQFFETPTNGINNSEEIFIGDGTFSFIDNNENYIIISYLYNRILRFDLPFVSGTEFTISTDRSTGSFVNAMDLDKNLDILYTNGTTHLARFTDITTNSPVRTNISNPLLNTISAIKVSPFTTTSSTVFVGTSNGTLSKVENANTATQIITDISGSSFLGSISSIEFGTTENEILVTFHNFGVTSIWYTADAGSSWISKEGDLPDFPVKCILKNPLNTNEVIIGTELGVWKTSNFNDVSPIWQQSYNGMSNVAVTSFSFRTTDNTILASTYGRGLFTGKFTANNLTVWTGAENDSDWTKTGNWSNGVPTSTTDVNIPNTTFKPEINASVSMANLSIETNATLTINALGSLTVEENLTNSGGLIINSSLSNSGSLIVKGNSTGNITYKRAVGTNWHLVSSPLIGQEYDTNWVTANSIASGTINTNQRGIATYNNNSGSWQYMLAGETATFNTGKGYSTLKSTSGNLSFTGDLLTRDTIKTISKGTNNAFNLVGNVYTSYIPVNADASLTHNFLETNSAALEEQTIWFWNGSFYEAINQVTGTQFVSPGQGFFVKSKLGSNSLSFTKEMQSHQSTAFFKTKTSKPKITLKINNGKQEKSTNIFYLESASIDFDNGYDSSIYNGISSDFEIYTNLVHKKTNQKLAIQTLPKDYRIVVPIGYKALPNSELFISLETKNFDEELSIYLEDKKLKTVTKLNTKNSKYIFNIGDEKTNNTRFYLHTTHKSLSLNEFSFSDIVVYNTNNSIELSNLPVGKNTVELYSLLGKKVVTKNVNLQKESVSIHLKKGIYILKLITEKGTIDRKILIE